MSLRTRRGGSNLVGAFHEPAGVVCDLAVLETMERDDFVAGLAEVVRCGFTSDPQILSLVEDNVALLRDPVAAAESPILAELVQRAVRVKAGVVAVDLKESGPREVLNYGHTFGHAIEQVERFRWRHGAAVSVGMVFVAELARLAGILPADVLERHRSILMALGLPTTYRGDRWEQLASAMRRDKKTRGHVLRFVVLEDIGRTGRLEGPEPSLLVSAYAAISSDPPPRHRAVRHLSSFTERSHSGAGTAATFRPWLSSRSPVRSRSRRAHYSSRLLRRARRPS